ncbi:MAG: Gfo/Idh/MocA family oxidoreductase [Caldilineaceae bacterium]|nr:Gfo/Idh/MocA family oxidoreductase [Caldilineaceae bacterium]
MNPIRVGIAGLGRSGWDIHARLLEPLAEHYTVTAVVDGDPARRDEAVARFDCAAYGTYDELLADPGVELVVVALPSHLHADAAIAGLAAGKHVVVEKPMATSLADADRMVAAAAQADTVLSVFQNRRYNPDFVKVRSLIDSGIFGRIVQVRITESRFGRRWDWQTQRKFGGGTLNNTCPHFLDQALQLFGPREPEVFCHLDRTLTLGDADDHVKVVLKGDGAPTVDVEVSSACAYPGETWNIMGTQGGLAGSTRELRWKWYDPAALPPRELDFNPTPDRSYNRDEIPWQEGSWSLDEDDTPGYAGYYLDLFAAIRDGAPPAVTPESVRRVIWLQETCHEMAGF